MADESDHGSRRSDPDLCSFCEGRLKFATYIPPAGFREPGHRVYRCEDCGRVETFWEARIK